MPSRRVRPPRPRGRQRAWALATVALGLSGLRHRARLSALPVIPPSGPLVPGANVGTGAGSAGGVATASLVSAGTVGHAADGDRLGADDGPGAGGDLPGAPADLVGHGRVLDGGRRPGDDGPDRSGGAGPVHEPGGSEGAGRSDHPHDTDDGSGSDDHELGRFVVVAVDGTRLAPGALRDAVAYAEREGLDVVDLVPADLDAERAIELSRVVDPATFRSAPLAPGRGANQAVLVDRDVLARTGLKVDGPVEEADVADLFREAKHVAPLTSDLAVLPGLAAAPEDGLRRRSLLRALYADESAPAASLLGLAALGAGIVTSPAWGSAALVAYCAEPRIAVGGGPLAGAVRSPADAVLRPLRSALRATRTAGARGTPSRTERFQQDVARARDDYRTLLAAGTQRFLRPRRATCPWCGGDELVPKVDSGDLSQLKPGSFHVDGCATCGHVFSNPQLTDEGLDFYYRDFYSGPFQHGITTKFLMDEPLYRKRAELVRRHVGDEEPARWLDVGTGHGHFCLTAREYFPDTRFEAVDMGEAVVAAARRGWVDEAHQGLLPDLAGGLAGRFDVVSMHHCLEHTQEPRRQLAGMRTALRPGGLLHIEVPDPECWSGRLLGRWWGPWFQPQHQTLIPIGNLCEALEAEGFTIVATERRRAHEQFDATLSLYLRLHTLGPPPDLPWLPHRRRATARRYLVFGLGAPLLALAMATDLALKPLVSRLPGGPNAYRVLARLDAPTGRGPAGPTTEPVAPPGAGAVPDPGTPPDAPRP